MNILLLDDHLMTLDGYALYLNPTENSFQKVLDCKEFYQWLLTDPQVDLAVIDYNIPSYDEKNLHNGADCALLLKELKPNCRIILITAHHESMILYNINQRVQPYALISKIDFNQELMDGLLSNKLDHPYLSAKVKEAILSINKKTTLLDATNREILMYLTQGFKINQLDQFLSLSKSGIQKKVSKMIVDFEVKDYHELVQVLKREKLL